MPVGQKLGLGSVIVITGLGLAAAAAASRSVNHPARRSRERFGSHKREALRLSRDGAAILAGSVLLDSAMEHFRGGFERPAMYAAPITAAIGLASALAEPRMRHGERMVRTGHLLAIAVGVAGLGFHSWNVLKRPGRISWNNLFYAAPIGAPGALATAGLLSSVGHAMSKSTGQQSRHGRQLAGLSALALLGETAEVALLHFRGAFHNPAMMLPVSLPPLAAIGLLAQAVRPTHAVQRPLHGLLCAVEALGYIGTGFHIYGVARNMGGWGNWRQNALAGPPVPAPISFTGLAKSGRAALDLLEQPNAA
jgi:hypothetical protein